MYAFSGKRSICKKKLAFYNIHAINMHTGTDAQYARYEHSSVVQLIMSDINRHIKSLSVNSASMRVAALKRADGFEARMFMVCTFVLNRFAQ